MPTLLDPILTKLLEKDKQYLEETELPIVTVSATFREDLKGLHGLPEKDTIPDIVFSRAHYSMPLAVAIKKWGKKIDHHRAWLIDPTNYVSSQNLTNIELTEKIAKTLARHPYLKKIKDLIDQFGRQKLPILSSIAPPLIHLTQNVQKPILSLHIAAGNILAACNKKVIQVITDPHVREDYLAQAERPNIKFCVFDEKTKYEFLEKAARLKKQIEADKIIVTGPPIDPRILAIHQQKKAWRNGPLRLCLTTGGLGTNIQEIKKILSQLLPLIKKRHTPYRLMIYAGTHQDLRKMILKLSKDNHTQVFEPKLTDPASFYLNADLKNIEDLANRRQQRKTQKEHLLTLLYHPQIVDANELLMKFAFPWAHGFITKPSGDMAYDAAAANCFLLTLSEWGVWEKNIRQYFEQLGIARQAQIKNIVSQIEILKSAQDKSQSWIEQAMLNALTINRRDKNFLKGVENIIKAV